MSQQKFLMTRFQSGLFSVQNRRCSYPVVVIMIRKSLCDEKSLPIYTFLLRKLKRLQKTVHKTLLLLDSFLRIIIWPSFINWQNIIKLLVENHNSIADNQVVLVTPPNGESVVVCSLRRRIIYGLFCIPSDTTRTFRRVLAVCRCRFPREELCSSRRNICFVCLHSGALGVFMCEFPNNRKCNQI